MFRQSSFTWGEDETPDNPTENDPDVMAAMKILEEAKKKAAERRLAATIPSTRPYEYTPMPLRRRTSSETQPARHFFHGVNGSASIVMPTPQPVNQNLPDTEPETIPTSDSNASGE